MAFMPGFGAPGPRQIVRATETEGTNLWLPIKQAIAGALALDVFLLIPMLSLLLIGKALFPILGFVFGYAVGPALRLFTDAWEEPQSARVVWGTCAAFGLIVGLAATEPGWAALGDGVAHFGNFVSQLFAPYGWWTLGLITSCLAWGLLRKCAFPMMVFVLGSLATWGGLYYAGIRLPWGTIGSEWQPGHFHAAFARLKWLGLPLLWPWALFAAVLAVRKVSEIAFGTSVPLQIMPAQVEDISPWDVLFPGISHQLPAPAEETPPTVGDYWIHFPDKSEEPTAERLTVAWPNKGQNRERRFAEFLQATLVHHTTEGRAGQSLSQTGAMAFGYSQRFWRYNTRSPKHALPKRGYAVTRGTEGMEWTPKGLSWAAQVVERVLGLQAVHPKLHGYLERRNDAT